MSNLAQEAAAMIVNHSYDRLCRPCPAPVDRTFVEEEIKKAMEPMSNLLAACKEACQEFEEDWRTTKAVGRYPIWERLKAAIAKAESVMVPAAE